MRMKVVPAGTSPGGHSAVVRTQVVEGRARSRIAPSRRRAARGRVGAAGLVVGTQLVIEDAVLYCEGELLRSVPGMTQRSIERMRARMHCASEPALEILFGVHARAQSLEPGDLLQVCCDAHGRPPWR